MHYFAPPRNMLFGILVAACLIAWAAPIVSAQSKSDGSVYGRFGLGERRVTTTSQAMGMGVLGVAIFGPAYLNVANPAAYGDQVFTRFASGIDFLSIRSTDESDESSTSAGGYIGSIQFGFPLIRRRLGFAITYSPYTSSGYRATTFDRLQEEGDEPGSFYEVNFEGDGGVHEVTAGLGYRVLPGLSLGATANAYWGLIESGNRIVYNNVTGFIPSSEQRTNTRLNGVSGTVGFIARSLKLFGKSDGLTFGGTFRFPINLSATRAELITQGTTLSDSLGSALEGDVTMPFLVQAGLTYAPNSHWLIVADGSYEPWSKMSSTLSWFGFDPAIGSQFDAQMRLGLGFQFLQAGNDPFAGSIARTTLRFGTFMEQSYVQPEIGYSLITYGLSAGLSIPTVSRGTYLDLSGQVSTRGVAEGLLVKDLLYRVGITLNFGERWFVQRRLR